MITPTVQSIDEALNKAKSLIQQGQLADAALYFSHAWARQPSFKLLQQYQQGLLQYCHYLIEQGDLETALQIAVDIDNFARAQAPLFEISDIEKLQSMLMEIKTFKQTIEVKLVAQQSAVEVTEKSQTEAEIAKLVKRTELFLKQAVDEPVQSELTLYYLNSAQSILQQLILLEPEISGVKAHAVKLSWIFEKSKQTISQNQSKVVWKKIQKELQAITLNEKGKAEQVIQQLAKRRQFLAEQANQLTAPEFLQQAQTLMEEINTAIADWQGKQQRFYDQWAIEQVQSFYTQVETRLGKIKDDKEGIAQDILNFFSNIDTRYLSLPVNTAYNEAFHMYYAKLDAEEKMSLSTEMALAEKRKLADF